MKAHNPTLTSAIAPACRNGRRVLHGRRHCATRQDSGGGGQVRTGASLASCHWLGSTTCCYACTLNIAHESRAPQVPGGLLVRRRVPRHGLPRQDRSRYRRALRCAGARRHHQLNPGQGLGWRDRCVPSHAVASNFAVDACSCKQSAQRFCLLQSQRRHPVFNCARA